MFCTNDSDFIAHDCGKIDFETCEINCVRKTLPRILDEIQDLNFEKKFLECQVLSKVVAKLGSQLKGAMSNTDVTETMEAGKIWFQKKFEFFDYKITKLQDQLLSSGVKATAAVVQCSKWNRASVDRTVIQSFQCWTDPQSWTSKRKRTTKIHTSSSPMAKHL